MKLSIRFVLSLMFIGVFAAAHVQASETDATRERMQPWPEETLRSAELIPVQEGGRVKPLGTLASFLLLRLNGKRSVETEWGERLTPTAWLLDCFFYPDQASDYRMVQVIDYRVLESIGLERRGSKRSDRYSLRQLQPGFERLRELGQTFSQRDSKVRNALETQVVNLSRVLPELLLVTSYLNFARVRHGVEGVPELEVLFPDDTEVSNVQILEKFEELRANLGNGTIQASPGLLEAFGEISRSMDYSHYISLLPPTDPAEEEYLSPSDVMGRTMQLGVRDAEQLETLRSFEKLFDQRDDLAALGAGIQELQGELAARADARGEFKKVEEEVAFYQRDWFFRSLLAFIAAFLASVAGFLMPRSKLVYGTAWGLALLGEGLLVAGIVIRCLLRDRPPVTTPYEAILFIVSVAVLICLFVEYTRRNTLALGFAALTGTLGMFLSLWNETMEGVDTMQPLVAVLDSNFWLSIHVTSITLGYCAGVLAALVAHLYIFGKLFGFKRGNKKYYADLSRMIYGVLCFGLLFSVVGTILGGVWANDSWGRFWGWDPKENGALMLCLGYLVIMHGRMGGYLREHGVAVGAVGVGLIVMWAFWGVNLIGVGLHSYGFTETKRMATQVYYATEGGVVLLGILAWYVDRMRSGRALPG